MEEDNCEETFIELLDISDENIENIEKSSDFDDENE